jgi:hypothetical protein
MGFVCIQRANCYRTRYGNFDVPTNLPSYHFEQVLEDALKIIDSLFRKTISKSLSKDLSKENNL